METTKIENSLHLLNKNIEEIYLHYYSSYKG